QRPRRYICGTDAPNNAARPTARHARAGGHPANAASAQELLDTRLRGYDDVEGCGVPAPCMTASNAAAFPVRLRGSDRAPSADARLTLTPQPSAQQLVMPAQAGIQRTQPLRKNYWIPAFAGMTTLGAAPLSGGLRGNDSVEG